MSLDGVAVAQTELKPPLKWAGGKRWLVPTLRDRWRDHAHRVLVEPFVGGMAVALGLRPGEALLNDINRHLINFYLWLRRGLVSGVATFSWSAMAHALLEYLLALFGVLGGDQDRRDG